jgi:hypothetical protein
MRITWIGARARVSSFVIDTFGLKADGKQGTLFGRERTCIVMFQLCCDFSMVLLVNINHQGHTISSSMA